MTGYTTHQRHQQHVVIDGQVAFLIDGSQLELVGSNLVVTGLDRNAQLQSPYLQILHEGRHTLGDGSKVMVFQLLVLAGFMSQQGTSGQQQVGTCCIKSFIDQEIFLLPSEISHHFPDIGIEIAAHLRSSFVHGTQGTQQGSLVIQRLAGIGNEDGRDAEGVVHHEDRRGRIPCTISTGLEGVADAAVRETAGIGFLLHKQFAAELFHHTSFSIVFQESIVFLGRTLSKRLEPMGVVRYTQLFRPSLHAHRYLVGHTAVQRCSVVHHIHQLVIHLAGQILEHLFAVEHILGKVFTRSFTWNFYGSCLFLESGLHDSES